jgi:hypothetical protein
MALRFYDDFESGLIFIPMSKERTSVKENAFDMGIAGTSGAMDYSAGFGTPASPDASQDPSSFSGRKALGNTSNTAMDAPASPTDINADIDQIYSKSVTPSPDEVMTGMKHELHNMIKKDKGKAKELVIANLKKDPHFYGKLGMLNIDDKNMMNESRTKMTNPDEQMAERIKVLSQMLAAKGKKVDAPQSIKDALKDTRERKLRRYN